MKRVEMLAAMSLVLAACGARGDEEAADTSPLSSASDVSALRAEIARAFTHDPGRVMAPDWQRRITGAVGESVEPQEVRDIEAFFHRFYTEGFAERLEISGVTPNIMLPGSVVTKAVAGDADRHYKSALASQPSLLPRPGEPLTLAALQTAFAQAGLETLRPDIVLFAAHQYAVARANNAAIRTVPVGQSFPFKGFSFTPTYKDGSTVRSLSWDDDSAPVWFELDFGYGHWQVRGGAAASVDDIDGPQAVSAAELGRYLSLPGIQTLRTFDEIRGDSVPSPPETIWAAILNPGRNVGHRLRILSRILDLIEQHGSLRFETIYNARLYGEKFIGRSRLTRELFVRGLPSNLYRAGFDEDGISSRGDFFVEGGACPAGSLCPRSFEYLFDLQWQLPRKWYRPELRVLLGDSNAPLVLPYGRLTQFGHEDLHNTFFGYSTEPTVMMKYQPYGSVPHWVAYPTNLGTWYSTQNPLPPIATAPADVVLPPSPPVRDPSPGPDHLVNYGGHSYDSYFGSQVRDALLFKDGNPVTPAGLELTARAAFAGRNLMLVDDKIFFAWNSVPPQWLKDRGTLVYDLATDTWSETTPISFVCSGATFDNGVLHLEPNTGCVNPPPAQTIDLRTLPLVPARTAPVYD